MTVLKPILILSDIARRANNGNSSDVDYFMSYLAKESNLETIKLVDFAISQIRSVQGIERIKYYLFNGTQIQRNYAALYFKRHKKNEVLIEALAKKRIDQELVFSR